MIETIKFIFRLIFSLLISPVVFIFLAVLSCFCVPIAILSALKIVFELSSSKPDKEIIREELEGVYLPVMCIVLPLYGLFYKYAILGDSRFFKSKIL